jgi:hypothetical protein
MQGRFYLDLGSTLAAPIYGQPAVSTLRIPNDAWVLNTELTLQGVAAQAGNCIMLSDALSVMFLQ